MSKQRGAKWCKAARRVEEEEGEKSSEKNYGGVSRDLLFTPLQNIYICIYICIFVYDGAEQEIENKKVWNLKYLLCLCYPYSP